MSWPDATEEILGAAMDEFGEDVTFLPKAGGSTNTRAVFNAAGLQVELQGHVAVQSVGPVLAVQLSLLPSVPTKDDVFVIRGSRYFVVRSKPDGRGGTHLDLKRHTS